MLAEHINKPCKSASRCVFSGCNEAEDHVSQVLWISLFRCQKPLNNVYFLQLYIQLY
ncbi:hypothetical protein PRUPE_1G166400 [Prunus persica]|uniref:Uncharacterized protein n=1 Tax=Prunus persica TaxID=3760 RepID=A0A251QYH7_PRUPE|nr:hypothetical protein PRUPE_1G166400 [Prunus persica]